VPVFPLSNLQYANARLDSIFTCIFDIAPETTTDASVRLRYLVAWAKVLLRNRRAQHMENSPCLDVRALRYAKYRAKSLVKNTCGRCGTANMDYD